MAVEEEFISTGDEDVVTFFLSRVCHCLRRSAEKKADGTSFLLRGSARKKMSQSFHFSKYDSHKVIDFLEREGLVRNGKRGLIIYG